MAIGTHRDSSQPPLADTSTGGVNRIVGFTNDTTAWMVVARPMNPMHRRVWESITALSEGRIGVRGLGQAGGSPSWPAVLAGGVFDHRGEVPDLLRGPLWTTLHIEPSGGWDESVELDLLHGVVEVVLDHPEVDEPLRIRRWLSASDPGVGVQRVEGPVSAITASVPLVRPIGSDDTTTQSYYVNDINTMWTSDPASQDGIVVSAHDRVDDVRGTRCIERIAVTAVIAAGDVTASRSPNEDRLRAVRRTGVDELERRHRDCWQQRWRRSGTSIRDDETLDRAMRFATFQLLSAGGSDPSDVEQAAGTDDELAIGARGVTGRAYLGHVFWDTDVFVVPALSAISPGAAERALTYRWNRLGPALDAAVDEGRRGARFPWESASSGRDVTPRSGTDVNGKVVPIRTGDLEVHIVGDIAWSAWNHVRWTGNQTFWRRRGQRIAVETARYWASRIECDDDGVAHIDHVIGPDEYHEDVNDNVFTNAIARHNLRIASEAEVSDAERIRWNELADALVDGFDETTGVYEQFAGFAALDPVLVEAIGTPPLSADTLLGHEAIQRTQISKQPDVLMAYHLVPAEMRTDAFLANVDYYLPRTAAGSSLAPSICASLLARAGDLDRAYRWFDLAARLDLDDLTGTTAGGLHLATIGGLWQAVTRGFLGVSIDADALCVDPRVPVEFGVLTHRFRFMNGVVTITADADDTVIESERDLAVSCGDVRTARRHRLIRRHDTWEHR